MISRPIVILMVMLLGYKIIMSTAFAENIDETSSSSIEVSDNETKIDSVNDNELILNKVDKTNTNVSKQKKRSIKMIVGGQSEDGVAKQVTLPVKD